MAHRENVTPDTKPRKVRYLFATPVKEWRTNFCCQNSQAHNLNQIVKDRRSPQTSFNAVNANPRRPKSGERGSVPRSSVMSSAQSPLFSTSEPLCVRREPDIASRAPTRSMKQSSDSHNDRATRKKTRGKTKQKIRIGGNKTCFSIPTPKYNHTYRTVVVKAVTP